MELQNNAHIIVSLFRNNSYVGIINQMIDDYDEKEKSWIYYFVKYPYMTQPANRGENIFVWWSNYNIRLLEKRNLSSYNVNPYLWTLRNQEEIKDCFKYHGCAPGSGGSFGSFLILNNELIILVADEPNTWIVRITKDTELNFALSGLSIKYRETKDFKSKYVDYFYNYDTKVDFIKEGVKLVKELIEKI
jgi:hypothetical protein